MTAPRVTRSRDLARVTGAAESSMLDAATIAAGIPARELMRRAGVAAATRIAARFGPRARGGVAVYVGSGNNGGDGWVVARELARRGFPVRIREATTTSTGEAEAAREDTRREMRIDAPRGDEQVIVDALLGIGSRGAPRGPVANGIAEIDRARDRGASVIALDVPSGLDATTGSNEGAVRADLTVTFATMKRGLLVSRDNAGAIEVVDIGIPTPRGSPLPRLVDASYVRESIRPLGASSHKGTRRKIVIVGGTRGMAGAVILAGRGAFRAGVGMVRTLVAPESVAPVQAALPEASAFDWPRDDESAREMLSWADAVVVGPGLGDDARAMVERVLRVSRVPVVLDADAITAFAREPGALGSLLGRRPAILTPHAAELGKLVGASASEVLVRRFEAGAEVASKTGAVVIAKGIPTVCSAPDGGRLVSASGNAALAIAGSGDLLSGVAGTLLAQTDDPHVAAASAAWAHGRAAELARGDRRTVRGITLDEITHCLGDVWEQWPEPLDDGVVASLPAAGDRG